MNRLIVFCSLVLLFGCANPEKKDDLKLEDTGGNASKAEDAGPSMGSELGITAEKNEAVVKDELAPENRDTTPPPTIEPPPSFDETAPVSGTHASKKAHTAQHFTLKRNCNIREKASPASKSLKKLKKGTVIIAHPFNKLWYKTKTGFIAKKCWQ